MTSGKIKKGAGAGAVAIDIPAVAAGPPREYWGGRVGQFAAEDPKRVIFSLKVGLAVMLVSLLILIRAPYDIFGTNIIWSILTVAIMFEYTVGATFNRGFNRALGSLLAGIFAVVVMQVAMSSGRVLEPYLIGFSIFLIGAVTSFMKLWPSFVPYEYGFRVTLFTYCLIVVSGYRLGAPVRTAMDRLYSIAIGGLVAVVVNVLICPTWAGEQLHEELVESFAAVADSLEECVKKYLRDDGSEKPEFSKTVMDEFPDEPAFKKCRAALNSSAKLDSLANSAKWEPPHGRFRHFFYPWAEYVKVAAVLRHCAYEVVALHGCLHSEIQAPYNLRMAFQTEILDATTRAAELLRSLGGDVGGMTQSASLRMSLLKRVHAATDRLQRSVDMHSYLLTAAHELAAPEPPVKPPPPPPPPAKSAAAAALSFGPRPPPPQSGDGGSPGVEASPPGGTFLARVESYHEVAKKQQRRLYSWPSREVDDQFEESAEMQIIPKMRALECTAALSLATFASLLIEFVARLDHLVEAVDELAKIARFRHDQEILVKPTA